jgi:hypothetical protein
MDGGRVALSGFLYQLLGTAGFLARDVHVRPAADDAALDASLCIANDGARFEQEAHDQDALISLVNGAPFDYVLLQFKFSGTQPLPTIGAAELGDIVAAFKRSYESMTQAGVSGDRILFVLATNRTLGPSADKLRRTAQARGKEPLARLIVKPYVPREAIDRIKELGRRLGLTRDEVESGIRRVVGEMVTGLADGMRLTRKWMMQSLVITETPRIIDLEELADVMRDDHARFRRHREVPSATVRRAVHASLDGSLGAAIVLLRGGGGLGKTVLLSQVTQSALDPPGPSAYVAVETAQRMARNWLSLRIQKWRGVVHEPEASELAFARLVTAAGADRRPVLWVGVDSIDEFRTAAPDAMLGLCELIDFVEQKCMHSAEDGLPIIRLLLTYRSARELDRVWPRAARAGYEEAGRLLYLELTPFDDDEAMSMLVNADTAVRERIRAHLRAAPLSVGLRDGDTTLEELAHQRAMPTGSAIASDSMDALRNPTLLQLFLEKLRPEEQMRFLDGDASGASGLWTEYIARLESKASRRQAADGSEVLVRTLVALARGGVVNGLGPYSRARWQEEAVATGHVGLHHVQQLYEEASTFGVIVEDPQDYKWHWVHPGVVEHLASRGATGNEGRA